MNSFGLTLKNISSGIFFTHCLNGSVSFCVPFVSNVIELGKFAPYARYATFPIEVSSEFEVLAESHDQVQARDFDEVNACSDVQIKNLDDQEIKLVICGSGTDDNYFIDLGKKNKLTSVNFSGGDTGGANATNKHTTFGATYTTMGATVGMQRTSLSKAAASSDQDRTHIAASFAVNESLSVSYGMSTVEFEAAGKVDQEDSGFAASYTMGSMSLSASSNKSDNASGTSGNDDTHKEIGLAFAF